MTKHLTQRFIDLRRFGLAPQAFTELRFYHAECCLDVRAFVIVRQELIALKVIEVKDARPQFTIAVLYAVCLKGYVRDSTMLQSRLEVAIAQVRFVCANLFHLKATLRCSFNERLVVVVVARVSLTDFNTRYDVGLHSAHEMDFDPIMLFHFLAVLGVKPAQEVSSSEARTINCKVSLDGFQGQAGLGNELFKVSSQRLAFEIARDAVVVREFRDEAACVRFSQVAGETSAGERRVGLKGHAKEHVSDRQARTPERMERLFDARAEFIEQGLELTFLMRLRFVVSRPRLLIRDALNLDRLGNSGFAILCNGGLGSLDLFDGELNSVDVFTLGVAKVEVGARAGLRLRVYFVFAVSGLGRNEPEITVLCDVRSLRELLAFLLADVHCVTLPFVGDWLTMKLLRPDASNRVWLNVEGEASTSPLTAMLAEAARFELAEPCGSSVFKTVPIDRYGTPPLANSFLLILFKKFIQQSTAHYTSRSNYRSFNLPFFCFLFWSGQARESCRRCRRDRACQPCSTIGTTQASSHGAREFGRLSETSQTHILPSVHSPSCASEHFNLAALYHTFKNTVNARKGVGVLAKVIPTFHKHISYINRRHKLIRVFQNLAHGIGKANLSRVFYEKGVNLLKRAFRGDGLQARNNMLQLNYSPIDIITLNVQRVSPDAKGLMLLARFFQCAFPVFGISTHNVLHSTKGRLT